MATGWLKGTVKAVPSGDTLLIMGNVKGADGIPPEKAITLSSLMAPRLARRDTSDDPFAWDSREFLRNQCIGKEVTFRVDYAVPNLNNREFGTVFLGDTNLAMLVTSSGWAKVRQTGPQILEKSPYYAELCKAEEQAQQQGLGIWNKAPGSAEASVRSIPPSAMGDTSSFDAHALLNKNKGQLLPALVEQVRDGSCFRVYLLPSFQFVQVHLAGVQAPSMGRRVPAAQAPATNGEAKAEDGAPLTTAQRLAASSDVLEPPEKCAKEAKHFTESRILHREIRLLLEGTDNFNTLFGSVSFLEGDKPVDLAMELLKLGFARYAEWSANMLEEDEKRRLKAAELQAKRSRLGFFTDFVIPASNSRAIKNDVFTGKVVEVVSGDCIIVADESASSSSSGERRVNLSSIQAPKATRDRADPFAREAKEFLRSRLIGQQVHVSMEYSRTIPVADGQPERVLDFGSVFLLSAKSSEAPLPGQPQGVNVAELVVANGFAQVVKHRDFDDRSHYYNNLVDAEKKAKASKKGLHDPNPPPPPHINDLTLQGPPPTNKSRQQAAGAQKAKQFLPFLQRSKRLSAVVDFVLSGHRYKLHVPKESCMIAFSLSGVRAPGRGEPFSDEAIAFMRRRILQRDVEIEVETVDRTGTFLGSLWDSKGNNVAAALLEAGLAKLQAFAERVTEGHLLSQAEESAKKQRLKLWQNQAESEQTGTPEASGKQETLQVKVTEVLGEGRFYAQLVNDSTMAAIQQQLQALRLTEKMGSLNFQPKKGDIVLAHFSLDDSWYRAMVVNTPKPGGKDAYEIFYVDYGNAEVVPSSKLRAMEPSTLGSGQWQAFLCSLAFIRVPSLEQDFGEEAAEFLSAAVADKVLVAKVEEKDLSSGKVRGQGTGPRRIVTLSEAGAALSVNAAMLQEGLARLEKRSRWSSKEKVAALGALEEYQESARKERRNIWQYGDVESDEEDQPRRAPAGGRR